jgi:PTS system mannose-specific IID component
MAPVKPARPRFGRALLRLFAVQGSYNYERMLGLGVGVAEEPLLRGLPADGTPSPYRAAVARGAHFFNAHPYLAGLAVGAAARAEHDGAPAELIERLRAALCGPLGSIGDRLIWAGWLPLLSGLALAAIGLGAGWTAVVGFLVIYNIGHVALRWWALREGWKHGVRVASALHHPLLQRGTALAGPAMACAVGVALPLTAQYLAAPFGVWPRAILAVAAVVGFAAIRWLPGRVTGLRLGLGFAALALVVGWTWL